MDEDHYLTCNQEEKYKHMWRVKQGKEAVARFLNYVDELKILGVTFDKRMDFKKHVSNKISSGKKLLFKFHGGQGKVWGLSPRMALYAYTGIIRPSLTLFTLVELPVDWKWLAKGKLHSSLCLRREKLLP